MKILIPHGVSDLTPSGVGLAQAENAAGTIYATSPCCGERFSYAGKTTDYRSVWCEKCLKNHTRMEQKLNASLTYIQTVDTFNSLVLSNWLRWVTGNPKIGVVRN